LIQPNTYSYFWNVSASGLLRKMYTASKAWWTPARIQQARAKGLTPVTANILASIVEEETNAQQDKGKIASVYLNRLAKGIKLGADPTIKYAMRDFELKEIYFNYLKVESPYNTYEHAGLPPGPICTPSTATLEAVLEAPSTDYLYFVAKPDFSGYSNFAATYKEHLAYANEWREALKKEKAIRAAQDSAKKAVEAKK
ncbi:MAG TPA: endolytic transglycosylase MltG, partial [Puia sp.]|nr:endolytic transglycosylase MltG [Puia sp.]